VFTTEATEITERKAEEYHSRAEGQGYNLPMLPMERFPMPTLESLGIDKLSTEERLALADAIYESVSPEDDSQTQPTMTPQMREMLRDRVRHADENPQLRISAEVLLSKLEARHEGVGIEIILTGPE
jgi:hypothetical protein